MNITDTFIQNQANKAYPHEGIIGMYNHISELQSFTAGAEMMLEHMGKIMEWAAITYDKMESDLPNGEKWWWDRNQDYPIKTTQQLIEEYFSTL